MNTHKFKRVNCYSLLCLSSFKHIFSAKQDSALEVSKYFVEYKAAYNGEINKNLEITKMFSVKQCCKGLYQTTIPQDCNLSYYLCLIPAIKVVFIFVSTSNSNCVGLFL